MTNAKPFIALLRRADKCKYKSVFMMNHMFLQCYDLAIDSEVGLHYVMIFPESETFEDPFYDGSYVLTPKLILKTYTEGHQEVDTKRKELKLKPKELVEEVCIKNGSVMKLMYYLQGELVTTRSVPISPIEDLTPGASNIERTYTNLYDRIKVGGAALSYDGLALNLPYYIIKCPEIYFYLARLGKTVIRVPFSKSLFMGLTKLDKFVFTLQETTLPEIYQYTLQYGKGGLEEIFWGYIQNY